MLCTLPGLDDPAHTSSDPASDDEEAPPLPDDSHTSPLTSPLTPTSPICALQAAAGAVFSALTGAGVTGVGAGTGVEAGAAFNSLTGASALGP